MSILLLSFLLVILVGLGLLMHQKEHFANMGDWRRLSLTDHSVLMDKMQSCSPSSAPYLATNIGECFTKCDNDLSCNTIQRTGKPACMHLFCKNMDGVTTWKEGEKYPGPPSEYSETWTRGPMAQPLAAAPVSSSYNTPQPVAATVADDIPPLLLQPKQLMQLSELIQPNPYGYNAPWNQLNDDPLPEEEEEPEPCPKCPDMSKYIRLDEVPCWNCSLP
jgi:hypothetical protein